MKHVIKFSFLVLIFSFVACNNESTEKQAPEENNDTMQVNLVPAEGWTMTVGGITLTEKTASSEFPDAELSMSSPEGNIPAGEPVHFEFAVKNYELQSQSPDVEMAGCANSGKGQHIHVILNNAPYLARYETSFDENLDEGGYVCLAFLSRSYHESIKNGKAHVLSTFTVGNAEAPDFDLSAPHLFYSRPKGTYTGEDTKKVLLDFFLVNCDLSEDGYKVKATIDGNEFLLTKWAPYFIEGMPMGENTIRLELVDANGETVPSPFNPVERTITLEQTTPSE